jgi:TetR/AcrR family transcriptional repressor of nem operon
MRTHFAEVLARESASLAGVTDVAKLAGWRRRVVRELMTPQSPYALALRQTGDVSDRADFLGRWRGLIEETVDRLLQSSTPGDTNCSPAQPWRADVDAQETAVLILAALHGGGALSQVAQDPWPLNASLDLALAPFNPPRNARGDDTRTEQPDQ